MSGVCWGKGMRDRSPSDAEFLRRLAPKWFFVTPDLVLGRWPALVSMRGTKYERVVENNQLSDSLHSRKLLFCIFS